MTIKKPGFSFIVIWAIFSLISPFLFAQGTEGPKSKPGLISATPAGSEKTPAFPTMAKPGKQVHLPDGSYLIYGFDKKPKLGTVIMKVEIFTAEGKKDTSLEVKADAGMPSMRGAHETGDQPFCAFQERGLSPADQHRHARRLGNKAHRHERGKGHLQGKISIRCIGPCVDA